MDFRLAVRTLRRRWPATVAIVIAVALSVTTATSLFSIVDGLVLRPLPFAQADRLVALDVRREPDGRPAVRPDELQSFRIRVEESPLIAASAQAGSAGFFSPEAARDLGLEPTGIDSRFFRLLGLMPELGRAFTTEDERSPAVRSGDAHEPLPIIISHELALRLYGGSIDALGRHDLAGRPVRVVGVMPSGVKFPGETNLWAPVSSTRSRPPAYVALQTGGSAEQLAAAFPQLAVVPLRNAIRPTGVNSIAVLLAASILLVFVTWTQVGALLTSIAAGQLREIGIALALGGTWRRLARQFGIQSAVIGGAALVMAWSWTYPMTRLVVSMLPAELRRGQYLLPDANTFVLSGVLSVLGVAVLTALPLAVLRGMAPSVASLGRAEDGTKRSGRWRAVLLATQVSLTAMLLYLAGLTSNSFLHVTSFDYGFDAAHVLLFTPPGWAPSGGSPQEVRAAFDRRNLKVDLTLQALSGIPSVVGGSGLFSGPLDAGITEMPVPIATFDGRPRPDVLVRVNDVGRGFVRTLGATLVAGHDFSDEGAGPDDIVLVNQTLARQLLPAGIAGMGVGPVLNREIRTEVGGGRIVGVLGDLVQSGPATPPVPEVFRLQSRSSSFSMVAARTLPEGEAAVRSALQSIWGAFPSGQIQRLQDAKGRVLAPYRSEALLLTLLAALGLPIAGVGLVGALAYSVRLRTREIAIRLAIGAAPGDVSQMIVREALTVVGVGVSAGVAMGWALGALAGWRLFGVRPADLSTSLEVAVLFLTLSWLAAIIPAHRGARLDPATALRRG